jgi:hypothetical protein
MKIMPNFSRLLIDSHSITGKSIKDLNKEPRRLLKSMPSREKFKEKIKEFTTRNNDLYLFSRHSDSKSARELSNSRKRLYNKRPVIKKQTFSTHNKTKNYEIRKTQNKVPFQHTKRVTTKSMVDITTSKHSLNSNTSNKFIEKPRMNQKSFFIKFPQQTSINKYTRSKSCYRSNSQRSVVDKFPKKDNASSNRTLNTSRS